MRKIIFITIIIILTANCASLNKGKSVTEDTGRKSNIQVESIMEQNISNFSFILPKVDITIESNGEKQKMVGNVKYVFPGKYLISLRNNTGIEGARIYIDRDTVLANDRINRKVFYGSSGQLYKKYGISSEYIAAMLGDLVVEKDSRKGEMQCINGSAEIEVIKELNNIRYYVNCSKDKVLKIDLISKSGAKKIQAQFGNFRKLNNFYFPSSIRISGLINGENIDLEIRKAELYSGKDLVFIPGNNYELILLQ